MTQKFDPKAYVAAMAPVIGLTIEDAWRPVVEANIAATEKAAALVMEFPLEDTVQPAPVFQA
ncbi:DUF4089 domain-containing protein [Roseibium limicola]|uniref:DUF4089 domain-containing protein n=1 Tax=Roseibium limicola TaxID=2816037 RepID=A0A939ESJ2_9HYPH|nr:DUF4089 domain-containing protein [Roseibium limicola]MBO0347327.1 DUF4089 domain-containing protein [Roseibium limicola]